MTDRSMADKFGERPGQPVGPGDSADFVLPLKAAKEEADFCRTLARGADRLASLAERLNRIYSSLEASKPGTFAQQNDECAMLLASLQALSAKATITAMSLSVEVCPLTEWKARAQKGSVLDVFSTEGIKSLNEQIDQATKTLDTLTTILEKQQSAGDSR